ncbi:MAG: hypothetical protein JWM33_245 [Caulobacteraceae bacterium]|nr:hypothetical protein [Caulobacteraceae bacterium]
MRRLLVTLFLLCAGCATVARAPAAPDPAGGVEARLRAYVADNWDMSQGVDATRKLGFTGAFWRDRANRLAIRCGSGPLGVVTYVRTGDAVCAIYPYRDAEGGLRARVAMSSPELGVLEADLWKDGASVSRPDGWAMTLSPNPENEAP